MDETLNGRVISAVAGLLAGLGLYVLVEFLPDIVGQGRALLVLSAFVATFFASLLAMLGPLGLVRALVSALGLGALIALLLGWISLRFDDVEQVFDTPFAFIAAWLILHISVPFGIAAQSAPNGWRSYPLLFDSAWMVTVRYAAAWIFVALFWAVLFLSDALLGIVGITIIEDLIDVEPVPWALTGLTLGLAMAVAHELSRYVSPFLILRLLRLLLPMVLVVVVVFVVAIPFRGLSNLFGDFSAAGTLMAMALGGITLVTSAIDRDDEAGVSTGWMMQLTRALSVVLPVLGILALWAVALRVQQYGWTPERLAAFCAAGFLTVYGMAYALAALTRRDWPKSVRQTNIYMALAVVGVSVLWLSPVLNAERFAANSQVARILDGRTDIDNAPLWELTQEWGRPGMRATEKLRTAGDLDGLETLVAELDTAISSDSRYDFERGAREVTRVAEASGLLDVMPVVGGIEITADDLSGIDNWVLETWKDGCARSLPDGRAGCVLVLQELGSEERPRGFVLFKKANGDIEAETISLLSGKLRRHQWIANPRTGVKLRLGDDDLRAVQDGQIRVAPSTLNAIWIGETEVFPYN